MRKSPESQPIEFEANVRKQNREWKILLRFRPILRRLVGSADQNDLCLFSPSVSPIHALLMLDHDSLLIADTLSTSGTFINGRRLMKGEVRLITDGDVINFGDAQVRIHKLSEGIIPKALNSENPSALKERFVPAYT